MDDVLAEKVSSQVATKFYSFKPFKVLWAMIVLPVPVRPKNTNYDKSILYKIKLFTC